MKKHTRQNVLLAAKSWRDIRVCFGQYHCLLLGLLETLCAAFWHRAHNSKGFRSSGSLDFNRTIRHELHQGEFTQRTQSARNSVLKSVVLQSHDFQRAEVTESSRDSSGQKVIVESYFLQCFNSAESARNLAIEEIV